MTPHEQREQKGELLLEYHEAEDTLAHLREKATRIAERLKEISAWIETAQGYHPDAVRAQPDLTKKINGDPKYSGAMDFDAANTLVKELEAAHKKLDGLKKRKSELGLR